MPRVAKFNKNRHKPLCCEQVLIGQSGKFVNCHPSCRHESAISHPSRPQSYRGLLPPSAINRRSAQKKTIFISCQTLPPPLRGRGLMLIVNCQLATQIGLSTWMRTTPSECKLAEASAMKLASMVDDSDDLQKTTRFVHRQEVFMVFVFIPA